MLVSAAFDVTRSPEQHGALVDAGPGTLNQLQSCRIMTCEDFKTAYAL